MNEQKDGTDSRVLSTAALEMAAIKVSLTDWIGDFLWYWGNESSPIGEQDVAEMLVCVIARHHELSVQGLGFPFPGAKGLFEAMAIRTRQRKPVGNCDWLL